MVLPSSRGNVPVLPKPRPTGSANSRKRAAKHTTERVARSPA